MLRNNEELTKLKIRRAGYIDDRKYERLGLVLYTIFVIAVIMASVLFHYTGVEKESLDYYLLYNGIFVLTLMFILFRIAYLYFKLLKQLAENMNGILINGKDADVKAALFLIPHKEPVKRRKE